MDASGKLTLLFVCVENSNRSQMAEAFARIHGGDSVEAYSAGSSPSGVVNPKAIEAMAELDYDLSAHDSVALSDIPDIQYDFVATMGCGDACPIYPGTRYEDWDLPDPAGQPIELVRQVRNEIKARVEQLLTTLR